MEEKDLKNFATFLMHGFLEYKREMKRQKQYKKSEELIDRAYLRQIQESESSYSSHIEQSVKSDGVIQLTKEDINNAKLFQDKNESPKLCQQQSQIENLNVAKSQENPPKDQIDEQK